MKLLLNLLLCLCFFSSISFADIYQSVDENGVTTYSDQPNTSSKAVELPAANIAIQPITENTNAKTTSTDAANETEKKTEYTSFVIGSPKDQDSLFNLPQLTVRADVSPSLQKSDVIQFYYDGAAIGAPSQQTSITISKVENGKEFLVRGSHSVYATIIDKEGNTVKTTPSITIFLHYTSVNNN